MSHLSTMNFLTKHATKEIYTGYFIEEILKTRHCRRHVEQRIYPVCCSLILSSLYFAYIFGVRVNGLDVGSLGDLSICAERAVWT